MYSSDNNQFFHTPDNSPEGVARERQLEVNFSTQLINEALNFMEGKDKHPYGETVQGIAETAFRRPIVNPIAAEPMQQPELSPVEAARKLVEQSHA